MTEQNSLLSLTVVIPTYNRCEVLRRALDGYLFQSSPHLISELLVVDDGSTDDTQSLVAEFQRVAPFQIRYLRQPNRGPAAARNVGLSAARTQIVLYTDDDIVPHPDLVLHHVEWHRQNTEPNVAILGFVTWSPEVHATPFMRWYGEAGALFDYRQLQRKREIDYRFFYTCNLSLKRDFLQTFGTFNENFKMAAYEDIELGFRLNKAGMRILYNALAVGYHYQFFTFDDACRKKRRTESARQMFLQTEAGKHLMEFRRRRELSLSFRASKFIAMWFAKIVQLPAGLLDSRFPLPGALYHCLLWYHAGRTADIPDLGKGNPARN
jgi:glycosyltransferase involved in cell wall biosynthesis